MKLHALIVDDSKVMRGLVMKSLARTGLAEWEFTEAEDGEDALQKFDPNVIDIVFADWNMPKMSGIALAKQIRSQETSKGVPIVMVTSEKSMGKMEVALDQIGCKVYVTKPFSAEDLKAKIEKLVNVIIKVKSGGAKNSGGGFFKNLMG